MSKKSRKRKRRQQREERRRHAYDATSRRLDKVEAQPEIPGAKRGDDESYADWWNRRHTQYYGRSKSYELGQDGQWHEKGTGGVYKQNTPYSGVTRWCNKHWRVPVALPGGLTVYASSWMDRPTKWEKERQEMDDGQTPDVGFYMDRLWASDAELAGTVLASTQDTPFLRPGGKQVIIYPWPDQGTPSNLRRLGPAIEWLVSEIRKNKLVEVGCVGGHGRTGTLLALLMVALGTPPREAIEKVRKDYCFEAIETQEQTAFVHRWAQIN